MKPKPHLVLPFSDTADMERFWDDLRIAGLADRWHGPAEAFDLWSADSPSDEEQLYLCERKDDGEASA